MRNSIEVVRNALILTDRGNSDAHKYARDQGLEIKISRGVYLPRDFLRSAGKRWETRSLVYAARVLAAHQRMSDIVFCKETALFLYGIQATTMCPDVFVRSNHAYGRHLDFPAVFLDGEVVLPAGKVRMCHSALTHSERQVTDGLACVGLVQLLVECSTFSSARDALASASAVLSAIVRHPLTRDVDGREGAERVRGEALRGIAVREGFPRRKRAQRIVEAASADCDSLAEAYLVALLNEEGIFGWKQQYEVRTQQGKRLIDCAFPEHRIAIEIEGKVKDSLFSRSTSEGHRAYYNRVAELAVLGWTVVPIPASDVLYFPHKAGQTLSCALRVKSGRGEDSCSK